MDKGGSVEGNKKSSTDPREPMYKKWIFHQVVDGKSEREILDQMDTMLKAFEGYKYTFQLERGNQCGRLHWQGFVEATRKFRFLERFSKRTGINFAMKAFGNEFQNLDYCSKDFTFVGHRHTSIKRIVDPLEGVELRAWQKRTLEVIGEETRTPDNRKIHWFWEPEGGIGKTSLIKHVCMTNKRAIVLGGKAADMKNGIIEYHKKTGFYPEIIFINIVRSMESFVSYQGIEEIKDGIFYSGKYEGGMAIFNSPILIIMANFEPNISALSLDRWNIIKI